jgi:SAM-dependent methyltransferase
VGFKDHFSARASEYAKARPTYPASLFAALAAGTPDHTLAWDCGTGNGQAAYGLAAHFERVLATDPSQAQISEARPHSRITYKVGAESDSGLESHSAELVIAAQAAHWFDLDAFYTEAKRVLRPGGVVALWCYGLCKVDAEIDQVLLRFYRDTVGPNWPPERRLVDTEYRTLPFPFAEQTFPVSAMELNWSVEDLGAYLQTWSAVTRYTKETGQDPVRPLIAQLAPLWGAVSRTVSWPLAGRLGRVQA